jgi:hypothetical protein
VNLHGKRIYITQVRPLLEVPLVAAGLVQKAYDRLLEFALRSEPLIRSVADKRPAKSINPRFNCSSTEVR